MSGLSCDSSASAPLSKRLTLVNARGLHARASHKFVTTACAFDAVITVIGHNGVSDEPAIADSIMDILMLGAACGEDITITASGTEAQAALTALIALVESAFGEES